MSDKKMQEITVSGGKTIHMDSTLIPDSCEDLEKMLAANISILEAVRDITVRGIKCGMNRGDAAAVAMELHHRASAKANELVHFDEKELEDDGNTTKEATEDTSEAN